MISGAQAAGGSSRASAKDPSKLSEEAKSKVGAAAGAAAGGDGAAA